MNYKPVAAFLTDNSISFSTDEALSLHSTFKVGGGADLFVTPSDRDSLVKAIKELAENDIKFFVIGKGSNVLFDDDGYRGAVISTEKLNRSCVDGERLYAECGASFTNLSVLAEKNSLSGLEFAYGIPGSVGGAVFMNAGAYGGEVSDVLEFSEILDYSDLNPLNIFAIDASAHELGYRDSVLRHNPKWLHLSSCFKLKKGDRVEIRETMEDFMSRRKDKQPLEFPSAGSTFKRPSGHFTGALVEASGLKGYCVGGAQVSEKHAGFIINRGGATCADILSLIEHVKETVLKDHGVSLECEVIYVAP